MSKKKICAVDRWNPALDASDPEAEVSNALRDLFGRGVEPDAQKPWEDAFYGVGRCSSSQIERFNRRIDLVRDRFRQIAPERIAARLEGLRGGERDLWLGMIHYWSFRDEAFLRSLRIPGLELAVSGGPRSCVDREERLTHAAKIGYSREEAELMVGRGDCDGEGAALEDYGRRFDHFRYFRGLYELFLDELKSGLSSADSFQRAVSLDNMISQFNLSALIRGSAPISSDDLRRLRKDAAPEGAFATLPVSWSEIEGADASETPLVLRPSDLPERLTEIASEMEVGPGLSLFEFVLDYVDYIVLLPHELYRERFSEDKDSDATVDHAYRTVAIDAGAIETPGQFLALLAHETAHRFWFDHHVDDSPERLGYQGLNERYAYAFEATVARRYLDEGRASAPETDIMEAVFQKSIERVEDANRRLGLPENDYLPLLWTPEWDEGELPSFDFYPGLLSP